MQEAHVLLVPRASTPPSPRLCMRCSVDIMYLTGKRCTMDDPREGKGDTRTVELQVQEKLTGASHHQRRRRGLVSVACPRQAPCFAKRAHGMDLFQRYVKVLLLPILMRLHRLLMFCPSVLPSAIQRRRVLRGASSSAVSSPPRPTPRPRPPNRNPIACHYARPVGVGLLPCQRLRASNEH